MKKQIFTTKPIWRSKVIYTLDYKNYREATIFLPVMEFYLTMKVQEEVKPLLKKIMYECVDDLNLINRKKLYLGNLNAKRDWGHAKDYCEAYVENASTKKPDDYVISTGKQYSLKFVNLTAKKLNMK